MEMRWCSTATTGIRPSFSCWATSSDSLKAMDILPVPSVCVDISLEGAAITVQKATVAWVSSSLLEIFLRCCCIAKRSSTCNGMPLPPLTSFKRCPFPDSKINVECVHRDPSLCTLFAKCRSWCTLEELRLHHRATAFAQQTL